MPDAGTRRRILFFLVLPLLLLWGGSRSGLLRGPAKAPGRSTVAVRLAALCGTDPVPVIARGRWRLRRADGALLQEGHELHGRLRADEVGLLVGPWRVDADEAWLETAGDAGLRLAGSWYRGRLRILRGDSEDGRPEIELHLHLSLEDYVLGVLAGEMATADPAAQEALRAQAVAARTYALWRLEQGARALSDTTAEQRFVGVDYENEGMRRAVTSTRGRVLTWAGALLPAWYHAACGGHTADAASLGFLRVPSPPLAGVPDPECAGGASWERLVPTEKLDGLARRLDLGDWLTAVRVLRRDAAGRCLEARLDGPWASARASGEELRVALGLPSAVVRRLVALPDGKLRVEGAGRGHGVGLCQEGALRLARAGASYRHILAHYYPGARLALAAGGEPEP